MNSPTRNTLFGMCLCLILAAFYACKAKADEQPRWVVVPAAASPVTSSGTPYIFAWRLDTRTGNLEMCTYDPGGWVNAVTKLPAPEALNCTIANKP